MGQCVGVKVNINFAAVIRIYIQNLEPATQQVNIWFQVQFNKCSSATVEVINEATSGQRKMFPFPNLQDT